MRFLAGATLAVALTISGVAVGQEEPAPMSQAEAQSRPPAQGAGGLEAIVHRDTLFNGPFQSVTTSRTDLNLPWEVRSIRVRSGEWQICTGRNFMGRCTTIDRDTPTLNPQFRSVQSMRPTGGFGTGVGQSLRGAASEFFPAPRRNGQRIECQGGSNSSCTRQAANQFCRSVGWLVARTQAIETEGSRSYVADVLCARNVI